ncbi:uncharacterized protein [Osmerus mordax]|uniref:uncharacterized protein n=1 Tax=Osmerus mordax TaxID=8014 RepID=UPI00350FB7CD
MAVHLSRLVRTGILASQVTIKELSLVLDKVWLSEAALSMAVNSVSSLLRLWSVQCLDLTQFSIHPHSLLTLLDHHGPLTLRLCSEAVQQLAVVVYEAQDKQLTRSFLEKLGRDLTCSLDWEVLLYLMQNSIQNIKLQVDLRKLKLSEKNTSDLLCFLDRIVIKRPSTSFMLSTIREMYASRASDHVSSLLWSVNHVINLNTSKLNTVDCAALCFTLQHSRASQTLAAVDFHTTGGDRRNPASSGQSLASQCRQEATADFPPL